MWHSSARRKREAIHVEDAKFAISEFGGWVKNADTKITILAAVLGVLVTVMGSQAEVIVATLQSSSGMTFLALLVACVVSGLSAVAMVVFIFAALHPRVAPPRVESRFAWPSVARGELSTASFVASSRSEEAWSQARQLARIAKLKYRWFAWALRALLIFVVSASVALLLSVWISSSLPEQPPQDNPPAVDT